MNEIIEIRNAKSRALFSMIIAATMLGAIVWLFTSLKKESHWSFLLVVLIYLFIGYCSVRWLIGNTRYFFDNKVQILFTKEYMVDCRTEEYYYWDEVRNVTFYVETVNDYEETAILKIITERDGEKETTDVDVLALNIHGKKIADMICHRCNYRDKT